jgi:hypothetical protein
MCDVEFIDFKVLYKGIDTNLTLIEYNNLIYQRIDIHHYLEEIYKQSTIYLRDKKIDEILDTL